MSLPVSFSSAAYEDVRQCSEFLFENAGEQVAERTLWAIRDGINTISKFPNLGKRLTMKSTGGLPIRVLTVKGYGVYYRTDSNKIEIGRILHEKRHRETLLYSWLAEN